MHEYTHAVVGKVTALRATDKADLNDARRQYDYYLRLLKELNLELIEVETDAFFPENIVFEDLAIICHGIVLIPRPISSTEEIIVSYNYSNCRAFTYFSSFIYEIMLYLYF